MNAGYVSEFIITRHLMPVKLQEIQPLTVYMQKPNFHILIIRSHEMKRKFSFLILRHVN